MQEARYEFDRDPNLPWAVNPCKKNGKQAWKYRTSNQKEIAVMAGRGYTPINASVVMGMTAPEFAAWFDEFYSDKDGRRKNGRISNLYARYVGGRAPTGMRNREKIAAFSERIVMAGDAQRVKEEIHEDFSSGEGESGSDVGEGSAT